jgi:quercetin dioxygenase-like cupin family protein
MNINADLGQPALANIDELPWQDSPTPGIARRMLDRDGGEVARATSVVRYDAGRAFPGHEHALGEEFLVLAGVFQDEHGDYPAGTYVRNPPGSYHEPRSEEGCTLFVKLRQFDPADLAHVRIDTRARPLVADEHGWARGELHRFGSETVSILRIRPDAPARDLTWSQGAELLVLDGALEDERGTYPAGTWLRLPAGSRQQGVAAPAGVRCYLKTGHLPPSQSA